MHTTFTSVFRFLLVLACGLSLADTAFAFGFADVATAAKRLAGSSYKSPDTELPVELQNLDYDQYRDIRFDAAQSLWRAQNLPFEAAFFHRGGMFRESVKIYEVAGGSAREMRFNPKQFDYGANRLDPARLGNLGFAGFRLHYAINRSDYKDEVLAVLGATYFRALGRNQLYGVSARGLAIDTAQSTGEEFPRFTSFWLVRPEPGARQFTFYALLDSPRLTGAYQFVVTPGTETAMDIKARLFLRDSIAMVGFAPLTSMFLAGENQKFRGDDFRPEVHDSDGLLIHAANSEWIWRPLVNPKKLLVTSFALNNPRGFGLMQRDRKFDHYEDLESRYERRPSVWVEPKGSWGKGRVELVQIPVRDETNDNVVAYWVADAALQPDRARDIEYRLLWQMKSEARSPDAWVVQTRRGHAYERHPEAGVSLHVDFDGPALRSLPAGRSPKVSLSADANGQILGNQLYPNTVNGGWRLSMRVRRVDQAKPIELRASLRIPARGKKEKESETWSYILPPE